MFPRQTFHSFPLCSNISKLSFPDDLPRGRKDGGGFTTPEAQGRWVTVRSQPRRCPQQPQQLPPRTSPQRSWKCRAQSGCCRGSCVLSPRTRPRATPQPFQPQPLLLPHTPEEKASLSPSLCSQPTHACVLPSTP